jgi:rhodanese-related sulfurtransferase
MVTKGFKQFLAEANAVIDTVSVTEAKDLLGRDDVIFVDVRDAAERASGAIPGSIHAARGFLEFIADPEGPFHNEALVSGKRLILYCATGGRSALASKTLVDMGIPNVTNLAGGFKAWTEAGGASES